MEMPFISDDQQAFHQEERAIADIHKARRERRDRILSESVPLFIRNRDRILADPRMARCHVDCIRFGLAYTGAWNVPVAFLGGLLRLWENPLFQTECPKCNETAYFTGGGGSPLSGTMSLAMTCASCGHMFGANRSKVQTTVINLGKSLIASINNCNAGLGSMEDESLPLEDVVHTLELEEYEAKKNGGDS